MRGLNLFKKNKSELVAVFDVGAASVGGALIELKDNFPPRILFTERIDIKFRKPITYPRFTLIVDATLKKVAEKMQASGIGVPQRIYCDLFSVFYAYETRISKQRDKNDNETIVTRKMIDKIVDSESLKVLTSPLQSNSRLGDDRFLVEKTVMKVRLNGYDTPNPFDKMAREIEVSTFISVSARSVITGFNDILKNVFPDKPIEFHSFAFLLFSALRDIISGDTTYICVDIGGEVTDVSIIRDDVIHETISFPIGRKRLVQSVAEEFGTVNEEAFSVLTMYREGLLESTIMGKVAKVTERVAEEWLAAFYDTMKEIGKTFVLPTDVYVIGDAHIAPIYADNILLKDSVGRLSLGQPFRIKFIDASILSPFVSVDPKAKKDDLFIFLETIFVNKIFKLKK
jgi:hypothetical protein